MTVRQGLLLASDSEIDDAAKYADPMVLRGVLHQLTGDQDLATIEIDASLSRGQSFPVSRIAKETDVARLQAKAAAFLKHHRDAGAGDIALGPRDRLPKSLGLVAGVELPAAEIDIWIEQTGLDPWARGLAWREPAPARRSEFKVGVIGAGLSGLNAAVHLKRAGIAFTVLEKNPEVGGTWFENRYPGARVDTPSRSYTHIFGADFPYPYAYCPRDHNLDYLRWVADTFGVREDIVFQIEVTSMAWDEAAAEWVVRSKGPEGERTWRFNAVITCVGFLSRPNSPQIPGMGDFAGVACHTARWPEGLDLAGKRVAVIGSGASGYQTMPEIAKQATHTYLFQRTPSWCLEVPGYARPLPEQAVWLDRNFPFYVNFARFRLSWLYRPERALSVLRVDPDFDDPHARSPVNKLIRDNCVATIRRKLADRPDLAEKMIPPAPPLCSRPIMVDPQDSVYDALLRDDVTLVSDGIDRIDPDGVSAGGVHHPVDVIVYATGFKANDFLWPMEVLGRDGVDLNALWERDGARAYLGSMLPGFPNFFMSYGPNTNNFGGFQVIDLLEMLMQFALKCIGGLILKDLRSVEVTPDAFERYNAELDREQALMLYMDPRAHNYYTNEHRRSSVNCPIDFRRMWRWLRDPTGAPQTDPDAGVEPVFGGDLLVN